MLVFVCSAEESGSFFVFMFLLLSVVLWLARLWPIEMSKEDAGELLQTAVDEPHAHR